MLDIQSGASARIARLQLRYVQEVPFISIERARYYTESWKATENEGLALSVRVALAMKNVYENMSVHIDADDRIAGTWTEFFLGVPIDIERGLFNGVFEVELSRAAMIKYILLSNMRFVSYSIRKYGLSALWNTLRESKAVGAAMPTIGTTTMDRRAVNRYRIRGGDKKVLLDRLLPFWKGKTIAEQLTKRLKDAGVYSGDMEGFFYALPSTTCKKETIFSTGAAMGTWQGHLIIDHETPIAQGLLAMREDVRRRIAQNADGDRGRRDFLESVEIALSGVIIYAERLAKRVKEEAEREADPERKKILREMYDVCSVVPLHPATNLREAVQSYWTVKSAVELALPFNVHAPGRIDQYFYPFYKKDIDRGEITPDQTRELFEELLLKVMTHNMRPDSNYNGAFGQRYEGSEPVTLAGLTPNGADATNELTYLILDAAHRSKTALNIVVRIQPGSAERSPHEGGRPPLPGRIEHLDDERHDIDRRDAPLRFFPKRRL